jgi:hypothetical protein
LNLADALSERATLEGVQWLLRGVGPRRAVREQLQALLPAPATLGPCRLRQVTFKPGHRLTAHWDALVRMAGTEGHRARAVAVTWRLGGDADRRPEGHDLARVQTEALRRGVAAPFRRLTTELPAWGMRIQVSPLDARFPQLVRLSDPRYAGDMLAGAGGLSQPRPRSYAVRPIRYHPGKRHVLRYDLLDAITPETVFAKLYTSEDGARAFGVARQAADWLAVHGGGVTAARPLAWVARDGVVLYPCVVGIPLSEGLYRPGPRVARCVERAGAALHALHHLPPGAAGSLPRHDFAAEVQKAAGASGHIPVLLPSAGGTIRALLERAQEVHARLPQEPPTFTHGDFKVEHVWATPGGPTLIDFDGCRLADPAYDVGRFLAYLLLWHVVHDRPGLTEAQDRFLAGYAPGAPPERLLRSRLYEAVQLVKIARRVPLAHPEWVALTEQVLRRAQTALHGLERRLGVPTAPLTVVMVGAPLPPPSAASRPGCPPGVC